MKTGVQALEYLKHRLGIYGVASDQWQPGELYGYITEGRDEVLRAFSMAAPVVVRTLVALDDNGDGTWQLPSGARTPLRCLELRGVRTKGSLVPSLNFDQDSAGYEWETVRKLRLASHAPSPTGGIEGWFVLAGPEITAATTATEAQWGIVDTLQMASLKYAVVLALTQNEGSDAQAAMALYEREVSRLETTYSEFDGMQGAGLRDAMMMNYGELYGDSLY